MHSKRLALIAACIAMAFGATTKAQQAGQSAPSVRSTTPYNVQGLSTSPVTYLDRMAWSNFLSCIVRQNAQGLTQPRYYLFFVPGGVQTIGEQYRQAENIKDDISRGPYPGNLMAFGGPDPKATALAVSGAFKGAATTYPMTNVVVLFIGRKSDETRLANLIEPRGATFRFVDIMSATCSAAEASVSTPVGITVFPPPPPPPPPPPRPAN